MTSMTAWLHEPPPGRAVRFLDGTGSWRAVEHAELAAASHRVAGRLRELGTMPGDAVPVLATTSAAFVTHLFGAVLAGAAPAPFQPPSTFTSPAAYLDHLARLVALTSARVVALPAAPEGLAERCRSALGIAVAEGTDQGWPALPCEGRPPGFTLLQLSSGSTGPQRAVRVPARALEANLEGLRERWFPPGEGFGGWLPLYHDMGLIGLLLPCLAYGTDGWFLSPGQFLRDPVRWLECFSPDGAAISATPTFGLSHVVRRVRPHDLAGHDLSGWHSLVVGAERVDGDVLEAFGALLAPHGFDPGAVSPAYGLAEATLAVTGSRPGCRRRTVDVATAQLHVGHRVAPPGPGDAGVTLVSCGTPMPAVTVTVVGPDGAALPDRTLGEIEVSGPTVADGYLAADGEGAAFAGRLSTGDAGFLDGGELFVVGRLGDGIKVRGRWLFAEDLEAVAGRHAQRRPTVLVGALEGEDATVVLVEPDCPRSAAERIGLDVGRAAGTDVRVVVLGVPRTWLRRTTSGKPQRRAMWQQVVTRQPPAAPLWTTGDAAWAATEEVNRGRDGASVLDDVLRR